MHKQTDISHIRHRAACLVFSMVAVLQCSCGADSEGEATVVGNTSDSDDTRILLPPSDAVPYAAQMIEMSIQLRDTISRATQSNASHSVQGDIVAIDLPTDIYSNGVNGPSNSSIVIVWTCLRGTSDTLYDLYNRCLFQFSWTQNISLELKHEGFASVKKPFELISSQEAVPGVLIDRFCMDTGWHYPFSRQAGSTQFVAMSRHSNSQIDAYFPFAFWLGMDNAPDNQSVSGIGSFSGDNQIRLDILPSKLINTDLHCLGGRTIAIFTPVPVSLEWPADESSGTNCTISIKAPW